MSRLAAAELEDFAARLLAAGGFTDEQAQDAARLLVWANLRGADSHGVLRIPRYVEMVETGIIAPQAHIEISRSKGGICVLNCGGAPGPTAMLRAVDEAVARAREFGIGWCSARAISHAGAIGHYALRAAEAGMIGIVMCAAGPLMAYHGAIGAALATNPLAIGVPGQPPLLLDMSTSTAAWGKILAARAAGRAVPESWGMDETGQATSDPHRLTALSPLGGAKGSGLSLMIEVLASALVGNSIIAPALSGKAGGRFNGLALALEVDAFAEPSAFREEIRLLSDAVHGLPPRDTAASVLLPGERGFATARQRQNEGIDLPKATQTELVQLAAKLGVVPPEALTRGEWL